MRHLLQRCAFILICLAAWSGIAWAASTPSNVLAGLSDQEIHRLGERMYRNGILSDGTPLRGFIRGDVAVDSTVFSCSNCHTRSGLGAIEGQIAAPPVNGSNLFQPRYLYADFVKNTISASRGKTRHAVPIRPAYTDESLTAALLAGVGPNGRDFSPVMPRYDMGEKDLQIMLRYLHGLSSQFSPGVTEQEMHLATIVTDDVSAADREAMLAPLRTLIAINAQRKTQRKQQKFAKMFRMLDNAYYRDLSLTVWELKGPPETWEAQLETYYRKEPVFAIIGGISNRSWQPIHAFCEKQQIPDIFPITDLPVISGSDWYTMYASRGYYGEGETTARFLAAQAVSPQKRRILQVVVGSEQGTALAAGFEAAWAEAGSPGAVKTVRWNPARLPAARELKKQLTGYKPTDLLLWGGDQLLPLLRQMAGMKQLPRLYLSGRYLDKQISALPEGLKSKTYLTYPYRLPENEQAYSGMAESLLTKRQKVKDEKRIGSRTFSAIHILLLGLKELRLDFYRDALLDQISMRPDQYLPDFERYSFGPGQRYASKGCYVVQLEPGPQLRLKPRSEWVVF